MNYLSVCAIVKNEAPYIKEWIHYHTKLGVERFYIYENYSDDTTLKVLNNLVELDYPIEINQVAGCPAQFTAYQLCLEKHRHNSRWITFIDVDEFIVPRYPFRELLKEYEGYPALAMHWRLFGSNSWKHYEDKPVVERFTKRQIDVNPHIKCFVDPKRTGACFTPHRFIHDAAIVDENYITIPNNEATPEGGTCDLIQLNHYATKSYEECMARRSRPRSDTGTTRNAEEFFLCHDRNEVEDYKAADIWKMDIV